MGVWWHALAFVTHERAKMSHKPGRNVTQASPKCHTRAKMSHSHVIIQDTRRMWFEYRLSCFISRSCEVPKVGDWHSLQWRHNERDCVSNHQPHDCLLNRLFRWRSKKTLKLRVTGLCMGICKLPVTRKMFPFDDVSCSVFQSLINLIDLSEILLANRLPCFKAAA